jgi:osmotically-inducible protein OsmY
MESKRPECYEPSALAVERLAAVDTPLTAQDATSEGLATAKKVAEEAKHRILHQPHLTHQRIWCECDQGRLSLRGQVPSFYFKQLAQEAVVGMKGVRQIINEIEVVW